MSKSYKKDAFVSGLKFSFERTFKENKWKILLTSLIVVAAIVFGIVVAVKADFADTFKALQEINIKGFQDGFVASSSAFLARAVSLCFNIILLFGFSFLPYLMIFAEVLLAYRGYLFGLNFALIFVFYGLGSMITAIVVILPCQLLTLAALILFYVIMSKVNSNCKKYGACDCNRLAFFLLGLGVVLLLDLVETILLFVLNGKVIMVI